jgi:hypothetical protein
MCSASIKPSDLTVLITSLYLCTERKNCTIIRNFMTQCRKTNEYIKDNRLSHNTHTFGKKTALMSNKMASSLHTLPVELVYRILDQLDELTIFWSCTNVCTRLNTIIHTYHPFQVIFSFIIKSHFRHVWNTLFFLNVSPSFKLSIRDIKRQISSDSTVYLVVFLINESNSKEYLWALLGI